MKTGHNNARKEKAEINKDLIIRVSKDANIILNVPTSHLDRLKNYLSALSPIYRVQILNSFDSGRKNVRLLFIKAEDPVLFIDKILNVPYVAIAVNKVYVVDGDVVNGKVKETIANAALDKIASLKDASKRDGVSIVIRIQAFPPKIQADLIASMDSMWDEEALTGVDISPTDFTHMLSVVQMKTGKKDTNPIHIIGLTPSIPTDIFRHEKARFYEEPIDSVDGNFISRAYYKIQEVLTQHDDGIGVCSNTISQYVRNQLVGSVALDCGAAPGSWTKYLLQEIECGTVYSVDPGTLSTSVMALAGTHHMKMKIEEAIPRLAEEGCKIDLWVSDMCLHKMSDQVNWLLRAKAAGILSAGALFVLTLKCNIGYSSVSYDSQVQREVAKLEGVARDVEAIHLFSNRSRERTLVGFLADKK